MYKLNSFLICDLRSYKRVVVTTAKQFHKKYFYKRILIYLYFVVICVMCFLITSTFIAP